MSLPSQTEGPVSGVRVMVASYYFRRPRATPCSGVEQLDERPVLPAAGKPGRVTSTAGKRSAPLRMRTRSMVSPPQDLSEVRSRAWTCPSATSAGSSRMLRPTIGPLALRVSNCCTAGQPALCTAGAIPLRNFKPRSAGALASVASEISSNASRIGGRYLAPAAVSSIERALRRNS